MAFICSHVSGSCSSSDIFYFVSDERAGDEACCRCVT